ncbi:MAG: PAS domain S-box protein [Elainellaceae cyanobacterium]
MRHLTATQFIDIEEIIDRTPLTVAPDTSVQDVIARMSQAQANHRAERYTIPLALRGYHPNWNSCALILDSSHLLGIFTAQDIIRLVATEIDLSDVSIAEVIEQLPVTLNTSDSPTLFTALALMRRHQIQYLPVTDEQNHFVGLLTLERIYQGIKILNQQLEEQAVISRDVHANLLQKEVDCREFEEDVEQPTIEQIVQLQVANDKLQLVLEELHIAEEELHQQNEALHDARLSLEVEHQRYQDLFELAPDGYLITDLRGIIQEANRAAIILLNHAYLLGKPLTVFIAKPEIKQFLDRLAQLVPIQNWDVTLQPRDRPPVPASISVTIVLDAQGQPIGRRWLLRDISDRKQAEAVLQRQIAQEQVISEIAQDIRRSLDLNDVLHRTVEQVRQFLDTDRVFILRFHSDWRGTVVMESVGSDWVQLLSTTIYDPCFSELYVTRYRQGRVFAVADIHDTELPPCHIELLQSFQVRANLVVSILQGETLWGLLVAHHCSAPREWKPEEIQLLERLSTQVGIAIQQSELYQQTRRELIERRRMQDVLQESEERFRSLNDAAPIGICQMNADGICLHTNTCWQHIFELSAEDCLGNGWQRAVHPGDQQALSDALEGYIIGGQPFSHEFRILTPQRKIRWVSSRAATLHSAEDEITGYIITAEEITQRKQAEQKIREQAALIDVATDAIFVRDLENRILFWSHGAESLYGWTADEAIGSIATELFQQESLTQVNESLKITTEQSSWQGELNQVTKSGRSIIVASRWTLMQRESDTPKSILVVNTDITEKKQLEAQFYRAQRLENIGTLASGIAHDLNNIFTPILAIAQLLPMKLKPVDPKTQDLLHSLNESAKRGADLVKQVLSFARGTEGKPILLQPGHLISEVVQIIRQTFPKSIEIRSYIPTSNLWLVSANPTQLHQVFMNLCVNARDAMPDGGLLTISVKNLVIDDLFVQMHKDACVGNYVAVTIVDSGIGISPEHLEQIFTPFFTTKEPGQGTGLGLSTTLGIVNKQGGFMHVSSEVEQGTEFTVYLPGILSQAPSSTHEPHTLSGHGELILVVDDEPLILETTKAVLELYQYRVLTASNGIEAIAQYMQHQHDTQAIQVVLIDMMMPTMDGSTAIQTLQTINPEINIVAMSGLLGQYHHIAESMGAIALLSKPFTNQDLLQAVHQQINAQ